MGSIAIIPEFGKTQTLNQADANSSFRRFTNDTYYGDIYRVANFTQWKFVDFRLARKAGKAVKGTLL